MIWPLLFKGSLLHYENHTSLHPRHTIHQWFDLFKPHSPNISAAMDCVLSAENQADTLYGYWVIECRRSHSGDWQRGKVDDAKAWAEHAASHSAGVLLHWQAGDRCMTDAMYQERANGTFHLNGTQISILSQHLFMNWNIICLFVEGWTSIPPPACAYINI